MFTLTEKQKALADWIEAMTGFKWEGGSSSDFTNYVNKYRWLAEQASAEQQLMHEAEMDCIDAGRDW